MKLQWEEVRALKEDSDRKLRNKESEWSELSAQHQNRIAFLQAELQRLEELIENRREADSAEVAALRARIAQITEEHRKLKQTNEALVLSEEQIRREYNKLEAQLSNTHTEITRMKEMANAATQR